MELVHLQTQVEKFTHAARKLRSGRSAGAADKAARLAAADILDRICDKLWRIKEGGRHQITDSELANIVLAVRDTRLQELRDDARAAARQLADRNSALAANHRADASIAENVGYLRGMGDGLQEAREKFQPTAAAIADIVAAAKAARKSKQ